ncbi:MAG: PQQ-dependent sugar dehydrogenase [Phycisphaerales bacterium]|nr:PQQ-dependent sugar dehydrogenase [Phycisphaerales bacterium]
MRRRLSRVAGACAGWAVVVAGVGGAGPALGQTVNQLWETNCARCHGSGGKGGMARSLMGDGMLDQSMDRRFFDAVKKGVPKTMMMGFDGKLSDPEMWSLVNYLRELQAKERRERVGSPKAEGGVYSSARAKFRMEAVIEGGLDTPWAVDFLPDGKMLVTERPGRVRMHSTGRAGGVLSEAVFGVPEVRNQGQGGLMDVAVHPGYEKNGWVYLSYSDPKARGGKSVGMTKVVRGRIKDGQWADQQTIFEAKAEHYVATDIHFGSRMAFMATPTSAQDNRYWLYFTIGERGLMEMAQDRTKPNGKVHRVWDDGKVPEDNPFVKESGAYRSIWSFGHRNPQGLVFGLDGRLWETEHGPRGGDELNEVLKGRNYGWPVVSFGINYDGRPFKTPWPEGRLADGGDDDIVMPVDRWMPSVAACGLDVVRPGPAGEVFPAWKGDLVAGGLAGETVDRVRVENGKVVEREEIVHGMGRVRDVAVGPDGSVYVVLNGPDKVVRLVGEEVKK